ncbi:MAG: hypothetical protein R2824_28735 [Saprospiraceae bacterium]
MEEEALFSVIEAFGQEDVPEQELSITLNPRMAYTRRWVYRQQYFKQPLRERCCDDKDQESTIYSMWALPTVSSHFQLDKALEAHQYSLSILGGSSETGQTDPWTALGLATTSPHPTGHGALSGRVG